MSALAEAGREAGRLETAVESTPVRDGPIYVCGVRVVEWASDLKPGKDCNG